MKVFDAHAHLYDPRWYPAAFSQAIAADFERRRNAGRARPGRAGVQSTGLVDRLLSDPTGEATVRVMDQVGIERRVILILDWGLALGEAPRDIHEIHKEILAVCQRFPDRLVGFAGVDPRRPGALDVVRHAVEYLGARGLKLHPTSDWKLSDPRVDELAGYCAMHELPVLVHVGRTTVPLSDRHSQPAGVADLASRFPSVPVIAGHSGFERWTEFTTMPALPGNLLFDISGWQDLHSGRPEALTAALNGIVSAFPDRVCFGTDSPFFTYNFAASESAWLKAVSDSDIPPAALESLLGGRPIFGDWNHG
jgi:uncharacterized protein